MSSYLEADIEFAFIRTQQQTEMPIPIGNSVIAGKVEPIECLSFYCQPNQLKIASSQVSILTIQIKVNTDILFDEDKVDPKALRLP